MADPKQLEILKKGVEEWNTWRDKNFREEINFQEANLNHYELTGADLHNVVFRNANLRNTILADVDLTGANLTNADLQDSLLMGTYLSYAEMTNTNLSGSHLRMCVIINANLVDTKFTNVTCDNLRIVNTDLSRVIDLDKIEHRGPSSIDLESLRLSKGMVPNWFLRGCGLSDWEIESAKLYKPGLSNDEIINITNQIFELRGERPLQISNLFISYSHADSAFVDKLEPKLIKKGIRFWRDVHDLKAGRLEKQIDRAMRLNPTVLLVLSKNSIQSDWVEHEVKSARELEKELSRDVLCPVSLDDSWKTPAGSWSQVLMDQVKKYNILIFSEWKDDARFNAMFGRLVEGLDLFYKNNN